MLEKKDELLEFIFGEHLIISQFRAFALDSITFIFFDKIFMQR